MRFRYFLKPLDFECTLRDCPPGAFFFIWNGEYVLGYKSKYYSNSKMECFNESGEYLALNHDTCKVIPVVMEKDNADE